MGFEPILYFHNSPALNALPYWLFTVFGASAKSICTNEKSAQLIRTLHGYV